MTRPPLFDLALLDRRRLRARRLAVAGADVLLRAAADELAARLYAVSRDFPVAVDLATPEPVLAAMLPRTGKVGVLHRIDRLAGLGVAAVADAGALPLRDASIDLVVSALGLQWTEDLPGALIQIRRALRPDGLLLAAVIGGETLSELRRALAEAEIEARGGASPRVSPAAELRDMAGLLQRAGFALPVADQERLTLRYDDAAALMRDLRAMGATNVLTERARVPLTRGIVARAAAIYADRFADPDGRVRATFDIVWLSGWAPHESQQKPLRPGSAKARLADALGVTEFGAGEKAGR
ncbi:MAG: methyltransferase domain-containing protein [Bauldia sp.]|nr:methyltransferase domain-containing protein [Bauldia sp.]